VLALGLLGATLYAWLRWAPREPAPTPDLLRRPTPTPAPRAPAAGPAPAGTTPTNIPLASPKSGTNGSRASAPAPAADRSATKRARPVGPETALGSEAGEGRPVDDVFEAQLALACLGFSPGSLDGVMGSRTRRALRVFQQKEKLPASGQLDPTTRRHLRLLGSPVTNYIVAAEDLARLLPVGPTWLAKSQQARLDYATLLELVAERSWSHPDLIRRLNPGVDWTNVTAGTRVLLPNVGRWPIRSKAAFARIQLGDRYLEVFDEAIGVIAHYPCTVARVAEQRPVGELRVEVIAPHPNYTFDPARFPNSPEARQSTNKLVLPPGPNNPVGVVWIGLSRPGYGIHGTPQPEKIGAAESLGCFRLTNWDAEHLLQLVWVGMPVYVEP
jgi:lipoprotein-anchoring transpeptidase ErfK/SrfK